MLDTPRFRLRDFQETDRAAFRTYQTDPRYRALYDLDEADGGRADALFDLFASWQRETPRPNLQLGIFERRSERLCGCAGLRRSGSAEGRAVLGIELAPDDWGRYRVAMEVAGTLVGYGFRELELDTVTGETASGNRRAARLARWFGAEIVDTREGPGWMTARGWSETTWSLTPEAWARATPGRRANRG